MNSDLKYNGSGCRDKTAEMAILAAEHTPHEIGEIIDIFKKIAGAYGYGIENRIHLKNHKTGAIYK